MEFGYFTLSDNHYENNTRDANTFVTDITPVELTRRPTTVARSYESTYQHDRTYEQRTYDH